MYKMDRNSLKSNPAAHGLGGIKALNICMLKSVGSLQSLVEFNLGPPNTNPTTSGHGRIGTCSIHMLQVLVGSLQSSYVLSCLAFG